MRSEDSRHILLPRGASYCQASTAATPRPRRKRKKILGVLCVSAAHLGFRWPLATAAGMRPEDSRHISLPREASPARLLSPRRRGSGEKEKRFSAFSASRRWTLGFVGRWQLLPACAQKIPGTSLFPGKHRPPGFFRRDAEVAEKRKKILGVLCVSAVDLGFRWPLATATGNCSSCAKLIQSEMGCNAQSDHSLQSQLRPRPSAP